jgi:hypothetical protein
MFNVETHRPYRMPGRHPRRPGKTTRRNLVPHTSAAVQRARELREYDLPLREIAERLERETGVPISYSTVRLWCDEEAAAEHAIRRTASNRRRLLTVSPGVLGRPDHTAAFQAHRARRMLAAGMCVQTVADVMRFDYPHAGWTDQLVRGLDPEAAVTSAGALEVSVGERRASVGGVHVPMTPKECEALDYLAQRPGRLVPREELLWKVWGWPQDLKTRTLDSHLARVRQKLAGAGWQGRIENVRGAGYRLTL